MRGGSSLAPVLGCDVMGGWRGRRGRKREAREVGKRLGPTGSPVVVVGLENDLEKKKKKKKSQNEECEGNQTWFAGAYCCSPSGGGGVSNNTTGPGPGLFLDVIGYLAHIYSVIVFSSLYYCTAARMRRKDGVALREGRWK
jgi:hypothetical protein